jgi:hypothetical protein
MLLSNLRECCCSTCFRNGSWSSVRQHLLSYMACFSDSSDSFQRPPFSSSSIQYSVWSSHTVSVEGFALITVVCVVPFHGDSIRSCIGWKSEYFLLWHDITSNSRVQSFFLARNCVSDKSIRSVDTHLSLD